MIAIQKTTDSNNNKYHNDNRIAKKCYISPLSHNNEKNRRRAVRFSPKCYIKHTISIHDMTDEEITNTWIQKDEEYKMRQRCQELIALVAGTTTAHDNDDDDDCTRSSCFCLRGLESHTKNGKKRKEMNRYESKILVMDEQDQQYFDDRLDEEKISSVYREISIKCQIHAELMAQKDRRDVERYYNKNRSTTNIITLSKTIASAA